MIPTLFLRRSSHVIALVFYRVWCAGLFVGLVLEFRMGAFSIGNGIRKGFSHSTYSFVNIECSHRPRGNRAGRVIVFGMTIKYWWSVLPIVCTHTMGCSTLSLPTSNYNSRGTTYATRDKLQLDHVVQTKKLWLWSQLPCAVTIPL